MRRLLLVLAGLAVVAAGVVGAFVVHRLHESRNIVGSPTVEYVPKPPVVKKPPLGIQWPMYGLDPARTRAVDLPLRPPYRQVWRYHAGSLVEFPPAIGYNRLFFSTNSGVLTAISEKTGKHAWKVESHRCVAASPALGPHAHGTVYEVFLNHPPCNALNGGHGSDGEVAAFSVGHGRLHWKHTIGPSETSPLIVGDRLYVGDWNGDIWAFDANHGRLLWKFHTGGAIKGGLAFSGGRLYVGSYDGHVYCLSASGKLIWTASAEPRLYGHATFYSTPAVAYGRVYIGATDGKVYSFGARSGKLRWSRGTGGYVYASPAVWNQTVYAGSYSGRFYALNAATGLVRWSFAANGRISGSATVIGDVVYFSTLAERTYALDARTGKQLWTFPDGKYTPAIAAKGQFFLVGFGSVYGMVQR